MPLNIELHSSAPNGRNHHIDIVFLSDVVVNVSPAAIRTVTATMSAVPPPKVGLQSRCFVVVELLDLFAYVSIVLYCICMHVVVL